MATAMELLADAQSSQTMPLIFIITIQQRHGAISVSIIRVHREAASLRLSVVFHDTENLVQPQNSFLFFAARLIVGGLHRGHVTREGDVCLCCFRVRPCVQIRQLLQQLSNL